jgi:choline dehydrogenase-like flavoprotein
MVEQLLAAPAFRAVVAEHAVQPNGSHHHVAGSCRGSVDVTGRVNGCADLYVADSSVIDLPASGTLAPVVANATRLADAWLSATP